MDPGKLFDLNASKQTANPGDTAMAGGGPILAGNFMIFGAGSAAAASPTVSQQTNSKTPTPAIAEGGSAPSQSGDFLVFGGGQSTGGSQIVPPSGTATSGPQALTPVTETGDMTAAAGQAAGQAAQPNSNYVASLRRNTVTPRQTLPLPTTGPAAIPGNMRTASTARSGTDQTDSTWFVGAFNQAMDKYNRAAGLGDTKSAPPQDANDRETANSVLRMN
jgi:hypothetical protein